MTKTEKLDFTLLMLYKFTKNGSMLNIKADFERNNITLELSDLIMIKATLELKGYAVFQTIKGDFRAQITKDGVMFTEKESYSDASKSILELAS
jgi:hypothetical protein